MERRSFRTWRSVGQPLPTRVQVAHTHSRHHELFLPRQHCRQRLQGRSFSLRTLSARAPRHGRGKLDQRRQKGRQRRRRSRRQRACSLNQIHCISPQRTLAQVVQPVQRYIDIPFSLLIVHHDPCLNTTAHAPYLCRVPPLCHN